MWRDLVRFGPLQSGRYSTPDGHRSISLNAYYVINLRVLIPVHRTLEAERALFLLPDAMGRKTLKPEALTEAIQGSFMCRDPYMLNVDF